MTDIAKLGFEIDASGLQKAKTAAADAAKSMGQLGDAADTAAAKVKNTGTAATGAVSAAQRLGQVSQTLSGALSSVGREAGSLATTLGIAGQSQGGAVLGAALSSVSRLLPAFTGALAGTVPVLGSVLAGVASLGTGYVALATALAPLEDKFKQLGAQIKLAIGSESLAATAFESIKRSANEAGISIDSAVGAFTRIARNSETLGATTPQILQLTETIQKLGIISGASQGEVGSGMMQLSQALAAGRLNGDELRSILENMPALAKAIADGLGVSVGELRRMGAEGQLTSDKVFAAILGQTDKVRRDFESMPDTTERAFQRMTNQAQEFGANLGTALNSSAIVQKLLNSLSSVLAWANGQVTGGSLEERLDRVTGQINEERQIRGTFNRPDQILQGLLAEQSYLQEQLRMRAQAAMRDVEREQDRAAGAPITLGLQTAREIDSLGEKQKKLAEQSRTLEDAITRLNERYVADKVSLEDYTRQHDVLTRALGSVRAEAAQTGSAFDKLSTTLGNERLAILMGGGGGGTALARRAIQLAEQSAQQGRPVSREQSLQALIQEQALGAREDRNNLIRQTEAQRELARATGYTKDALIEVEVAQAAMDYQFQKFGTLTGPAITKAVNEYATALRGLKFAQAEGAAANMILGLDRQLATLERLAEVAGDPLAQRRIEQAARIEEQTRGLLPGDAAQVAARMRRQFELEQSNQIGNQIADLDRQAERTRQLGALAGDPVSRRQRELEFRIADATRSLEGPQAASMAAAMRRSDDAERTKSMNDQTAALQRQLEAIDEQFKTLGMTTDELNVHQAVTAKVNDLIAQGVDIRSAEARSLLDITTQLAIQENRLRKQQEIFAQFKQLGEDVGKSIREGIGDAFVEAFRTGKLEAQTFLDLMNSVLNQILNRLIQAALQPLTKPLETFVSSFTSNLFGSYLGGTGGTGGGADYALASGQSSMGFRATGGTGLRLNAMGNVYAGGNVIPFARGGVVGGPMFFPMTGGRTGLMGEAGPEAIMPLRRTSDGRLGVAAANDSVVNVVVNDMRQNAGAEQVEVREERGENGMRQISILIRDEVRRAMRSGELDNDLRSNFGTRRPILKR